MPLDLFNSLTNADDTLFKDSLEKYGFIPDLLTSTCDDHKPNPQPTRMTRSIPVPFVGFSVHKDISGQQWIGLTCAACHTGRIRIRGPAAAGEKWFIVEGAPAMIDFERFFDDVVAAVDRSPHKQVFSSVTEWLHVRHTYDHRESPSGFGRVDAFGQIFNEVSFLVGNPPNSIPTPDAPASFPFLWDIAQHKRVQWDGSAPNLGVGGDGAALRNIAETVGVFGKVQFPAERKSLVGFKGYRSEINVENIRMAERWISTLNSPVWPTAFGPLPGSPKAGKILYQQHCRRCHAELDLPKVYASSAEGRKFKVGEKITPLNQVLTDPRELVNFNGVMDTRNFYGVKDVTSPRKVFKKVGTVDRPIAVASAVAAAIFPHTTLQALRDGVLAFIVGSAPTGYKARPLNGIWATAPFLHNGSVPNLRQLLTAPGARLHYFCVGAESFDFEDVGYKAYEKPNPSCNFANGKFEMHTGPEAEVSIGDSNVGHDYPPTGLSSMQQTDLIAYIIITLSKHD